MTGETSGLGRIEVDELTLDPIETAARLRCPPDSVALLPSCLDELKETILCRYTFCRRSIARPREGILDLGFGQITSRALTKNLTGCEEAFLFALTLGHGVDRLLRRLSLTSPARHFVTDALASSLTETACDLAEERLLSALPHRPRFSPGYGDLSLHIQPDVLTVLDAERRLGITLSHSLLMSPSKSVTAIVGIL